MDIWKPVFRSEVIASRLLGVVSYIYFPCLPSFSPVPPHRPLSEDSESDSHSMHGRRLGWFHTWNVSLMLIV